MNSNKITWRPPHFIQEVKLTEADYLIDCSPYVIKDLTEAQIDFSITCNDLRICTEGDVLFLDPDRVIILANVLAEYIRKAEVFKELTTKES